MSIHSGLMAARAGDYPAPSEIDALKHIWLASGVDIPADTITDAKGSVVVDGGGALTTSGDTFDIDIGNTVVTGLTDFALNDVLIILSSETNAAGVARFIYGNATGVAGEGGANCHSNTGGANTCQFADGTTTVAATALSGASTGTPYTHIAAFKRGAVIQARRYIATGQDDTQESAGNTPALTTTVTQQMTMKGENVYGMGIFMFSALPDNWEAVAIEVGAIWRAGYPNYLPPEWSHL